MAAAASDMAGCKNWNEKYPQKIRLYFLRQPIRKETNKMATLLVAGAVLLGAVALRENSNLNAYRKLSTNQAARDEAFQINEDIDIGIRTKQNVATANAIYTDEVGGIIRSDAYRDIHNVRNNALDFQNKARIKNKALGEANFNPDNRDTVIVPSYGSKIIGVTVPNPYVFPGYEKIPNAWVDRQSPKVTCDNQAWRYRDPYGELISPYNMPQDIIQMDTKFGNPWGTPGLYNENIREGGRRLKNTADYDPKSYSKKQVRFKLPTGAY